MSGSTRLEIPETEHAHAGRVRQRDRYRRDHRRRIVQDDVGTERGDGCVTGLERKDASAAARLLGGDERIRADVRADVVEHVPRTEMGVDPLDREWLLVARPQ